MRPHIIYIYMIYDDICIYMYLSSSYVDKYRDRGILKILDPIGCGGMPSVPT